MVRLRMGATAMPAVFSHVKSPRLSTSTTLGSDPVPVPGSIFNERYGELSPCLKMIFSSIWLDVPGYFSVSTYLYQTFSMNVSMSSTTLTSSDGTLVKRSNSSSGVSSISTTFALVCLRMSLMESSSKCSIHKPQY